MQTRKTFIYMNINNMMMNETLTMDSEDIPSEVGIY